MPTVTNLFRRVVCRSVPFGTMGTLLFTTDSWGILGKWKSPQTTYSTAGNSNVPFGTSIAMSPLEPPPFGTSKISGAHSSRASGRTQERHRAKHAERHLPKCHLLQTNAACESSQEVLPFLSYGLIDTSRREPVIPNHRTSLGTFGHAAIVLCPTHMGARACVTR